MAARSDLAVERVTELVLQVLPKDIKDREATSSFGHVHIIEISYRLWYLLQFGGRLRAFVPDVPGELFGHDCAPSSQIGTYAIRAHVEFFTSITKPDPHDALGKIAFGASRGSVLLDYSIDELEED